MKAKTLTDKLQQLPAARREQVEARAAELVAEAAHNRDVKDVKGAAMTPEQMKQRAGELAEWFAENGFGYLEAGQHLDATVAILRAVAGGEVSVRARDPVLAMTEGKDVFYDVLVIQGGDT